MRSLNNKSNFLELIIFELILPNNESNLLLYFWLCAPFPVCPPNRVCCLDDARKYCYWIEFWLPVANQLYVYVADILVLPIYHMKFGSIFYLHFLLYIYVSNLVTTNYHNVEISILRRNACRGYRDEYMFHMIVL